MREKPGLSALEQEFPRLLPKNKPANHALPSPPVVRLDNGQAVAAASRLLGAAATLPSTGRLGERPFLRSTARRRVRMLCAATGLRSTGMSERARGSFQTSRALFEARNYRRGRMCWSCLGGLFESIPRRAIPSDCGYGGTKWLTGCLVQYDEVSACE